MEGVSAESNALFIAFRRLVYAFSQQVSKEECQAIVYIRLYHLRERYKDSTTLGVLSKLEADGVLGPANPEGLMEIAKDIKRQDLVNEVKDFIKKRSKSEKKSSSSSSKKAAATTKLSSLDANPYGDTEEDMQLKATIEVTLAQATVLMQQVEILERAVVEGKAQRQRAKEAISEAGQTAAALANRLRMAQTELGLGTEGASSAVNVPGEAVGVFSHSVPIGSSSQYALQPLPTVRRHSPNTCVPKQCSEFQGKPESEKLKTVVEGDDNDDDEDDYEKMQSFVANEEEIKAWRLSLLSQPTNYGRFMPPPRTDLHGSRPYSSHFSATLSQSERQFRPHSYVAGSQHKPQTDARQQTSGISDPTNAQTTNSPRSQRGAPNVNSSSTSLRGNSPPALNSSRLISNRRSASPQTMHKPTTIQDGTSPLTRPQHQLSHGVSGSPTIRSPNAACSQPSGSTLRRDVCTNQGNSENELDSCRSVTKPRSDEDSGNNSLVKARLQQLEKPATSAKPALLQKPNRPVAKQRKPVPVVASTLQHNASLQRELNELKTKAASTLPRTFQAPLQTSVSHQRSASHGNEDDAYNTMYPRGTSTSTLSNTGDSGFEDVRPLQRLEEEPVTKGDLHQPTAHIRPDAYTSLLNQRTTSSDRDGYSRVSYTSQQQV